MTVPMFSRISRSGSRLAVLATPILALAFGTSTAAWADAYTFSVSGSGITASGVLQVSNTGPVGAYTVTGISGTFSDSNNAISGNITGLDYAPAPTFNASPPDPANTFGAPAFTAAGFSYDNLFWPGGDSPAVCADALAFLGGYFDVYGMDFDVAGGYNVDIWSDGALGGYQVGDAMGATKLSPSAVDGVGYGVNVTTAATPEPSSLLLLSTGLAGVAGVIVLRRRVQA